LIITRHRKTHHEGNNFGVAEWCYEEIAGKPEESFMAFQNHIAIQQRLWVYVTLGWMAFWQMQVLPFQLVDSIAPSSFFKT
jgi:hypothetical protein